MSRLRPDVPASGVTAGYPGHHLSQPQLLPQLMEAANNCVRDYCLIEPGERVLVVAEPDSDALVVSSFAAAATLAGAEVATITVSPFSAGGFDVDATSDMLLGAFERSDVVIACTYFEFAHAEKTFFSRIFGSQQRVCSILMGATPGCLLTAGRFPMPLYLEIAKHAHRQMDGCKQVRYVTETGTDIVFDGPQGIGSSQPLQRGTWSVFPPMGINFYPDDTNGVFVIEESTITGRPLSPIAVTMKDNLVATVEGGAAADRASIEAFSTGPYYMRHAVVGLNPKIRMVNAPQFERERAAGTAYLGIDGTDADGNIDRTKPGLAHLDVIFDTPTVYVDGELMVKDRRLLLLEDEELMEFAQQYGEPRRILAQNPFIW
jgi:hypothetical protein